MYYYNHGSDECAYTDLTITITGFFDESDLSQVGLGQSLRFPAWGQRTGRAVLDVSEGVNRPGGPQSVTPPVEKTPPSHREPPPTTNSGLLLPRWKTVGWVRSSVGQVQSVEKTRRQLSQVAQCGRVMSINLVLLTLFSLLIYIFGGRDLKGRAGRRQTEVQTNKQTDRH